MSYAVAQYSLPKISPLYYRKIETGRGQKLSTLICLPPTTPPSGGRSSADSTGGTSGPTSAHDSRKPMAVDTRGCRWLNRAGDDRRAVGGVERGLVFIPRREGP